MFSFLKNTRQHQWNFHWSLLKDYSLCYTTAFLLSFARISFYLFAFPSYLCIIIMSCCQHRYLWPSLATSPYCSLPLAGLQGYILYPHRAAVCRFELVVLLLLGHMWGVHRSTSLMSSSLLLQQCPACLVCLTWTVFMMGGRWLYSWCFVGCCLLDLFNIACSILV